MMRRVRLALLTFAMLCVVGSLVLMSVATWVDPPLGQRLATQALLVAILGVISASGWLVLPEGSTNA